MDKRKVKIIDLCQIHYRVDRNVLIVVDLNRKNVCSYCSMVFQLGTQYKLSLIELLHFSAFVSGFH